jgi:hypothetical protein
VSVGGLARHFAAPPFGPKRASRRTVPSQGAAGRPDEQVASTRPDTSPSSALAPSLALPCGHTDGSPAATSTSGLGAATGPSCPFQRCRSVATHQSSLHAGRVRSGEGTATGRHLGRHAVCGSMLSREARHRAFRSSRGIARRDPPGFRIWTVFLESPHRIATREPPVDSNRLAQQWTGGRGQAGERVQDLGRRWPSSRLSARSNGRLIGRRPAWGCSFGERQGRSEYDLSMVGAGADIELRGARTKPICPHGRRRNMSDSSDPLGDCCQLTTGPYQGWMLSADSNFALRSSLDWRRTSRATIGIASVVDVDPAAQNSKRGRSGRGWGWSLCVGQMIGKDSPEGSSIWETETQAFMA